MQFMEMVVTILVSLGSPTKEPGAEFFPLASLSDQRVYHITATNHPK